MPKNWEFEDVKRSVGSARFRGHDAIRPTKNGLGLAKKTWERMGYPDQVGIRISTDLRAIQLVVPGPFHVGTNHRKGDQLSLSSVAVLSKDVATKLSRYYLATYIHSEDNIFVLDEASSGTIKP